MGVILFVAYQLLTRSMKGQAVARLPFKPIGFVARFTHRGVHGDDLREVGVVRFLSLPIALRAQGPRPLPKRHLNWLGQLGIERALGLFWSHSDRM